jgi:hypothetical protein
MRWSVLPSYYGVEDILFSVFASKEKPLCIRSGGCRCDLDIHPALSADERPERRVSTSVEVASGFAAQATMCRRTSVAAWAIVLEELTALIKLGTRRP